MSLVTPSKSNRSSKIVETTVFQSGNSQAVRIPKEFQFHTKRVEIVQEGRTIVLRPLAMTAAEALADLPPLSDQEGQDLDKAMGYLDDDLLPLDEPIAPAAQPMRRASSASKAR